MNAPSASPTNVSSLSEVGVTQTAVPPHVSLDESGRIASDIACRSCGYNLRSLTPDAACPECGAQVMISLRGDLLRYCDPKWVSGLARGITYILISIALGFALMVFSTIVGSYAITTTAAHTPPSSSASPPTISWSTHTIYRADAASMLYLISMIVSVVLALLGVWLITAAEPNRPRLTQSDGKPRIARVLARLGLIGGFVLEMIVAALGFTIAASSAPITSALAQGALMLLALLLFLVGSLALLVHLRRLALRVPDTGLAQNTRIVTVGLGCAYGLIIATMALGITVAIIVFSSLSQSTQPTALIALLGIFIPVAGCLDMVLFLVFGIWALVLIFWYRRRFKQAAEQASGLQNATDAVFT